MGQFSGTRISGSAGGGTGASTGSHKAEFVAILNQVNYTLSWLPNMDNLVVFVNGGALKSDRYTNEANTVTLDTPAQDGDIITFKP